MVTQPAGQRTPGELTPAERRRQRRAWLAYAVIALAVVVSDQLLKQFIVAHYQLYSITPVAGDWLRVNLIHNSGGLFGMFQNQVQVFAVITVVILFLLVTLEWRSGWRSWLTTIALALLIGGAVGNFIDRVTLGYVVDFADIGVGGWRWYIFNIADSAVTVSICLLVVLAFVAPRALSLAEHDEEHASGEATAPDAGPADGRAPARRDAADEPADKLGV